MHRCVQFTATCFQFSVLCQRGLLRHTPKTYVNYLRCNTASAKRYSTQSSDDDNPNRYPHPFTRTYNILRDDFKRLHEKWILRIIRAKVPQGPDMQILPMSRDCDVLIVGGGIIGSAIAYWLKETARDGIHIVVVEKDLSYTKSGTALSIGGLHQRFTTYENLQMGLFGAEFLRNIKQHLTVDGKPLPDICFQPQGYLTLASESDASQLEDHYKLQLQWGAKLELMSPAKLKEQFPWLNTDGVALGCYGLQNEGWFDPSALLAAYKNKAMSLGVEYVNMEAVGFEFQGMNSYNVGDEEVHGFQKPNKLIVRAADGTRHTIKFAIGIVAAGVESKQIAEMLQIGKGSGMMETHLPIVPRKRYVYCVSSPSGPGLDCPFVVDTNGTYFRREKLGGSFLVGRMPSIEEEPDSYNLKVDYEYFNERVLPELVHRAPGFQSLELHSAWASCHDYNIFDQNAVLGPHPYLSNMVIAAGFGQHGVQQAAAVGRAVTELILHGGFVTLDLTRLSFDRLMLEKPLVEACAV